MFFPGQKVECVGSGEWVHSPSLEPAPSGMPRPARGRVYRVTEVEEALGWEYLYLAECPGEFGFRADSFRPIVDLEIERLREIAEAPSSPALLPQAGEGRVGRKEHV